MPRYILARNIEEIDAKSIEEAIEKFSEKVDLYVCNAPRAAWDYYLCEVIAVYGDWMELPRGELKILKPVGETKKRSE